MRASVLARERGPPRVGKAQKAGVFDSPSMDRSAWLKWAEEVFPAWDLVLRAMRRTAYLALDAEDPGLDTDRWDLPPEAEEKKFLKEAKQRYKMRFQVVFVPSEESVAGLVPNFAAIGWNEADDNKVWSQDFSVRTAKTPLGKVVIAALGFLFPDASEEEATRDTFTLEVMRGGFGRDAETNLPRRWEDDAPDGVDEATLQRFRKKHDTLDLEKNAKESGLNEGDILILKERKSESRRGRSAERKQRG